MFLRDGGALLEFRLHEFRLSGRFYMLLPKLGGPQSEALAKRLADKGFAVLNI